VYTDKWVEKTVNKIINVSHRHLVFTIPEQLRGIIFRDRSLIKVMMDCAAKTALEVLQASGSKAVPGILAVVHTFGRGLNFHPHVHVLITEGGLDGDKKWQKIPFLPYALLRKKWQYYLLTEIKARLPKTIFNSRFIDQLFKNNGAGFYVNGASKMTSALYAARYIGRYIARPALAEHRIISYNGKEVVFEYQAHESNKNVFCKLKVIEFIYLLISHIAPKHFKMVRHYGLYARRIKSFAKKLVEGCRVFLQQSFNFCRGLKGLSWRERLIKTFGRDPLICPKCHIEMELWWIWHPKYGNIYDFSRDQPCCYEYEKDQKATKGKTEQKDLQLCLFSVWGG